MEFEILRELLEGKKGPSELLQIELRVLKQAEKDWKSDIKVDGEKLTRQGYAKQVEKILDLAKRESGQKVKLPTKFPNGKPLPTGNALKNFKG